MSIFHWDEWDEAGYRLRHNHPSKERCTPQCRGWLPPPRLKDYSSSFSLKYSDIETLDLSSGSNFAIWVEELE